MLNWSKEKGLHEDPNYTNTIICEVYPDNTVFLCCSPFSEQLEDPEEDGPDSGKRFIVENQRIYDTQFKHGAGRILECPFCHAEIRSADKPFPSEAA